ncbi:MAG: leucine--tRNA ligase [Candidatus Micrarchaeota archaeon]
MEYDFASIERKWQERWFGEKAFEPKRDEGRGKFFFTVPYPYVSGNLHVGHGRTYANGDVIARYKRMRGFNVLWPMAFHITGTPVLGVSSRISDGDAATIELYKGYVGIYEKDAKKIDEIVASFKEPWNLVKYFSQKLVYDFRRMGFSLDMSRQFTTGDVEYNRFVEWQFKKYRAAGYLMQASYPILYCSKCANAVGEDDIRDGDTDPVELQQFYALKSKFEDGFIISCTLRPETVFGITNMFVNPDATYAKIAFPVDGDKRRKQRYEYWFVSKEAVEKLRLQGKKFEAVGEHRGDYFAGKDCVDPLGRTIPILPSSFVDPNNASGFVHSVPAHAPIDYVGIEDLKRDEKTLAKYPGLKEKVGAIKPIALIKTPGFGEFPAVEIVERMKIRSIKDKSGLDKATAELYKVEYYGGVMMDNCSVFAGSSVEKAKEDVAAWLMRDGLADELHEISRPSQCRCGGTVFAAIMPEQWFIDFNAKGWKEKSYSCLEEMLIHPEIYRKQFRDVFAWLDKRPCARRRGLGTKLPFDRNWIIESLSDSTLYMAFYTVIKKIREHGVMEDKLTPAFFDYVLLGEGSGEPSVPKPVMDDIRAEFLYWYPNDLRHTGVSHITNHLSFMIFAHTAIFAREQWPRGISLNEMVISEGQKMSKSKGNVVLLDDVAKNYGADLFRLYMVSSADMGGTLDFRRKDIESAKRSVARFASLCEGMADAAKSEGKEGDAARWFLSNFESALKEGTQALEELRLRDYVQISFYRVLNQFEHLQKRASPEERAYVAKRVLSKWVRMLAPVMPHLCEELWERSGGKGFVSVADWPAVEEALINEKAQAAEDYVLKAASDAKEIIAMLTRKQPRKITRIMLTVASKEKRDALAKLLESTPSADAITSDDVLSLYASKNFYVLSAAKLREIDEKAVLAQAADFLSKELGAHVAVETEEESKSERKEKAMPLKPAITIE